MPQKLIITLLIGVILLTACGGSAADLTPTFDPNLLQTQAVGTFSAAFQKALETWTALRLTTSGCWPLS